MEKKNVLIISYSYPPSNAPAAQRPYAVAKYLDKSKYNITVITCANADSSLGFDASFDEDLKEVKLIKIPSKIIKNTSTLRESSMVSSDKSIGVKQKVKSIVFRIAPSLLIPDKAIFWLPNVKKFLKQENKLVLNTDILFTTSPLITNHLIGCYIKKKNNNLKWIADFRDFHFIENWSKKGGLLSFYHKRLENKIIKQANIITFISLAMQRIYEKHYASYKNKMNYVYNGYDPDDFKYLSIKPICNDKLTIFYAGSFYRGVRSPIPLLRLLDKAFETNTINKKDVVIKIAGNFETQLIEEIKEYKSHSCISFLGRMPKSEVLKEMTEAHLLWLIVGNEITHYTGVPVKFYEYLASRRPIINFAPSNSEPSKIIKEFDLGWNFHLNEKNEEKNNLLFLEILQKYKINQLEDPLVEKLVSKFTRDKQCKLFEKLFDD